METFRLLERNLWIDSQGQVLLALQHGDTQSHPGKAREFLQLRTEPV